MEGGKEMEMLVHVFLRNSLSALSMSLLPSFPVSLSLLCPSAPFADGLNEASSPLSTPSRSILRYACALPPSLPPSLSHSSLRLLLLRTLYHPSLLLSIHLRVHTLSPFPYNRLFHPPNYPFRPPPNHPFLLLITHSTLVIIYSILLIIHSTILVIHSTILIIHHPRLSSSPSSLGSCRQPSHPSMVPSLSPSPSIPSLGGHLFEPPVGLLVRRGAVGGQERGPRGDRVGEVKRMNGERTGGREGGRGGKHAFFVLAFLSLILSISLI